MINILVVDPANEYGSLIKGVIMSRHFGVSVSNELSEAKDKLNTGLFDMFCIDNDVRGTDKFIDEVKDVIPSAPVISLIEKEYADPKIFRCVTKPLSLSAFIRAVSDGVAYLDEQKYKAQHQGSSLPAEISIGKESLRCRLSELGLKGAIVAPFSTEPDLLKQFASFFVKRIEKISTTIIGKNKEAKDGEEALVKIQSKLAYTEQAPDLRIKYAGISFAGISGDQQKILEGLIASAA